MCYFYQFTLYDFFDMISEYTYIPNIHLRKLPTPPCVNLNSSIISRSSVMKYHYREFSSNLFTERLWELLNLWRHKLWWRFLKWCLFLRFESKQYMLGTKYSNNSWLCVDNIKSIDMLNIEYFELKHRANTTCQTGNALNRHAKRRFNDSVCTNNIRKGFHN